MPLSFRRRELLAVLDDGEEHTITQLAALTDRMQPSVARDLTFLLRSGLVERRYEGLYAYYRRVEGGAS